MLTCSPPGPWILGWFSPGHLILSKSNSNSPGGKGGGMSGTGNHGIMDSRSRSWTGIYIYSQPGNGIYLCTRFLVLFLGRQDAHIEFGWKKPASLWQTDSVIRSAARERCVRSRIGDGKKGKDWANLHEGVDPGGGQQERQKFLGDLG